MFWSLSYWKKKNLKSLGLPEFSSGPPLGDANSGRPCTLIHNMPCRTPCRLFIHELFFGPLGLHLLVWSELGRSLPFRPMRALTLPWLGASSLVCEVALRIQVLLCQGKIMWTLTLAKNDEVLVPPLCNMTFKLKLNLLIRYWSWKPHKAQVHAWILETIPWGPPSRQLSTILGAYKARVLLFWLTIKSHAWRVGHTWFTKCDGIPLLLLK